MEFRASLGAVVRSLAIYGMMDIVLAVLLLAMDFLPLRLLLALSLTISLLLTLHFPLFYAFYRVEVCEDGVRFRSPYPFRRFGHNYNDFLPWTRVENIGYGYTVSGAVWHIVLLAGRERYVIPVFYIDDARALKNALEKRFGAELERRRVAVAA